jgi:catechol 2,3-dioxygenase-like lactoylglutathione lyase family enzyme
MFDHVGITVSDRADSVRFYALLLDVLGQAKTHSGDDFDEWDDFALADGAAVTRGLHIGFRAASREHVDAFWRAGVDAGYRDDGPPGPRPQYTPDYYGSFLLDPDGNSAEALHYDGMRADGVVDHLWIRVADVDRARRFYETVAPHAGFVQRATHPDRANFGAGNGSFAVVHDGGATTENVHLAFPATANAAVDAFHRALVEAGYADNGPPGERPQYHAGYYAAFVLDPDGNNVELVNHHRVG